MNAEQLTIVSSNRQTRSFVPQTTNQEHTPISSNYTRKQAFMSTQNNRKIFVPGKRNLKIFLLKNPRHGLPFFQPLN
jgi:hypothetical protein